MKETLTCEACGREYTRKKRSDVSGRYCSQECARRDSRRYERMLATVTAKRFQYSLEYDPWQTGQLPSSVLQNALWSQP